MRNFFIGILFATVVFLLFRQCGWSSGQRQNEINSSILLQQEINNVSKLIVSEGHFSQVYTYENSENFLFDFFSSKKSAVVVVNTLVTVGCDLRKLQTRLDDENRIIEIVYLPELEINTYPDLEFYHIENGYLNAFNASDYERIKTEVKRSVDTKIFNTSLLKNAQNRLLSELQKLFLLSQVMGWEVVYKGNVVTSETELAPLQSI